jgi:hypothetical protein
MRRLVIPFLVVLALPAAAHAGGWATVGLSSTPAGTAPGSPWSVDVEVLQHGRTPLQDVEPAVIVTDAAGKSTRFDATPTGKPGVYRAEVVFPKAGEYSYAVDDGFIGAVHNFPSVTIGAAAPTAAAPAVAGDDGGFPWLALTLGLAGAGALAALALTVTRRRGHVAA